MNKHDGTENQIHEGRISSVIRFDVNPENVNALSAKAEDLLENKARFLAGFIEGQVLLDESKTQIVTVTQFESPDAWAQAQWREEIARAVVELFEATHSYDLKHYSILKSVTAAHKSAP